MSSKYGVMFVGLCGHLSTTAMAGAFALAKDLCPATGMISEMDEFKEISFADLSDFVFGGWEIRPCHDSRLALKDLDFESFDDLIQISKLCGKWPRVRP